MSDSEVDMESQANQRSDRSPQLRYRRLGGGYRREDVERALDDLNRALRALDIDLEQLKRRSEDLESELRGARSELAAYKSREGEIGQALEGARTALLRASKIETAAEERARGVVGAIGSLRDAVVGLERAVTEVDLLADAAEGPAPEQDAAGGTPEPTPVAGEGETETAVE